MIDVGEEARPGEKEAGESGADSTATGRMEGRTPIAAETADGESTIPTTYVSLPSYFWHATIILRC